MMHSTQHGESNQMFWILICTQSCIQTEPSTHFRVLSLQIPGVCHHESCHWCTEAGLTAGMLPVFLQVTHTLSILARRAVSAKHGKCCGSISVLCFPLPEPEQKILSDICWHTKPQLWSESIQALYRLIWMPQTAHVGLRTAGMWMKWRKLEKATGLGKANFRPKRWNCGVVSTVASVVCVVFAG